MRFRLHHLPALLAHYARPRWLRIETMGQHVVFVGAVLPSGEERDVDEPSPRLTGNVIREIRPLLVEGGPTPPTAGHHPG